MTAYGYYVPFMWIGSVVYLAGSMMYYLLQVDSGAGMWVGCQLVAGVGFGVGVQVRKVDREALPGASSSLLIDCTLTNRSPLLRCR